MNISLEGFYNSLFSEGQWLVYLEAAKMTLLISLYACIIGIAIGLIIAMVKYTYADRKRESGVGFLLATANFIANGYTTIIRGTPVLLQLIILYALVASEGFNAAVIGFGINSGAYVAEIFRAGLSSVDKGQQEAGRSLGLSANKTMRLITIPQAFKNILPALFNEFISLIKETSVAGSIAVVEITKIAERYKGKSYMIEPLFIAAAMYLVLTIGLTQIQKILERRLARSDRS
jgi:arginine/lysine/histidine transport system permease protein